MKDLTVGIATFNSQETVSQALESVTKVPGCKIIVQDNQSTDNTLEIIESYKKKISITILSNKDEGIYDAFNKLISYTKTKYLYILNSDDILNTLDLPMPDAYDIYGYSIKRFTDTKERLLLRSKHPLHIYSKNCLSTGVIYNMDVFEKVGLFDTSYKICGDYDFFCRCADANVKFFYDDTVLNLMRKGGVSTTKKYEFLKYKEQNRIMYKYKGLSRPFFYPYNTLKLFSKLLYDNL